MQQQCDTLFGTKQLENGAKYLRLVLGTLYQVSGAMLEFQVPGTPLDPIGPTFFAFGVHCLHSPLINGINLFISCTIVDCIIGQCMHYQLISGLIG